MVKSMKFESNIPSYLKTGQGVFPVQRKSADSSMAEFRDLSGGIAAIHSGWKI